MTHSKDHPSCFDSIFDFQAIIDGCRHRFFTENMVALVCKGNSNLGVEMVLDGD